MITPRLEMILRHIKGNSCADIGTDHAYIPIKLAERGMRVIATDIRPGPLEMAEKNIKKHNKNIELRLGGGLLPIEKGETDTVIIAGMGGEIIAGIIAESEEKARAATLVIQPMNGQCELRKYLAVNNFCITEEDIAVEGFKVYNLMTVKSGKANEYRAEIEFHLPTALYSHPLFPQLLAKKKREFEKIYAGLSASRDNKEKEMSEMKELLSELEKIEKRVINEAD